MEKNFTKYSALLILTVIVSCFSPGNLLAQTAEEQFNTSLEATAEETGHADLAITKDNLAGTIGELTGVLLSFLGVVFLLLMIYGGYIWMLARGNEQQVEKAKKIIINSIIGLLVVLSAYAITTIIGTQVAPALIE